MSWMKDLTEKGHYKASGPRLEAEGRVVRKPGAISDGPYTEAKDIVGGFMIVEAKDIDEAAQLAGGCPIFARGGFVEVRPVMKL
jgi:hypothetical protein